MHQKVRRLALEGVGIDFHMSLAIYSVWKTGMDCLKSSSGVHWGRWCTAPNDLPNVGLGDAPKCTLRGLGGGVYIIFNVSFLLGAMLKTAMHG